MRPQIYNLQGFFHYSGMVTNPHYGVKFYDFNYQRKKYDSEKTTCY